MRICKCSCTDGHAHACTLLHAGFQLLDVRLTDATSITRSQGGAPGNRTVNDGVLAVLADNM